jgi:hypothetical protein
MVKVVLDVPDDIHRQFKQKAYQTYGYRNPEAYSKLIVDAMRRYLEMLLYIESKETQTRAQGGKTP